MQSISNKRRVLFATPGKDASTVAAFAADLKAHGGDPDTVTDVSADMSQAFFNGVTAHLPKAAVTFDKFHVVSLVNTAVEKVRRIEQKTSRFRQRNGLARSLCLRKKASMASRS